MEELNYEESQKEIINDKEKINEKLFKNELNNQIINNNDISYFSKIKKFDLNEHLFNYLSKINFLQEEKDSKKENYCVSCKLFFSAGSNLEHVEHEIIDHSKDLQNINFFNELFEKLESKFFNSFTEDLNVFDSILKKRIEDSIEKLMNQLNILKKSKIEDMENLVKNYKINFEKIKKNFFELKFKFVQFYKKNDTFLNISSNNKSLNNLNNNNTSVNYGNKKNQSTYYESEMQKSNLISGIDVLNNNTNINNNNNNLNISTNKYGSNNLNVSSLSILNGYKSNNKISKNQLENKILNDVFYLINLDLNKTIELTENKLENFLDTEKNKIKSQADILENLFEEFIQKINEFKLQNKINPINKNDDINKIPDFTHSLHLRLKKYTEILDNLNFTILEMKNPNAYKKIESLIGNMENDIIYKISQRNAQGNINSRMDLPEIFYEMELKNIVDNLENLDEEIKDNENNKIIKNNGNLTSKNKQNNEFKKNFNFADLKRVNFDPKSKSDNKKLDEFYKNNLALHKNINNNSDFNFNSNLENQNTNYINYQNKINKHKKNNSLNLDKINLSDNNNKIFNSDKSKNQSIINLPNLNTPSSNSNFNINNNENLSNSINNFSMINNSVQNKSNLSFLKNKEELLKKYLILSLMGTYEEIQEMEEEHENIINNNNNSNMNNSKFEKLLKDKDYLTHSHDPIVAKIIENTNEMLIYDKKTFSISKHKINLSKESHGIDLFLDGSRTIIAMDKIFIIGGRDALNQYSLCLEYDFKLNFIRKIQNMKNPRAYHSLIFNPISVKILAIGGENNKTCEEYDLYKGIWNDLPDLNVPRAYINCYLNKQNNILYALFGMKNEITKNNFTDSVEILNLDKRDKGWIKIDYSNKSDINLRNKYVHVFPIEADKLLIVGNCFSRYNQKNFAVYDMKLDNISKIDSRMILEIRRKSRNDPALKKLLVEINKSLN